MAANNRDRATLDEILGLTSPPPPVRDPVRDRVRESARESVAEPVRESDAFVSESYKGTARTTLKFPGSNSNLSMVGSMATAAPIRLDDRESFQKLKTTLHRRIVDAIDLVERPGVWTKTLRQQIRALAAHLSTRATT